MIKEIPVKLSIKDLILFHILNIIISCLTYSLIQGFNMYYGMVLIYILFLSLMSFAGSIFINKIISLSFVSQKYYYIILSFAAITILNFIEVNKFISLMYRKLFSNTIYITTSYENTVFVISPIISLFIFGLYLILLSKFSKTINSQLKT